MSSAAPRDAAQKLLDRAHQDRLLDMATWGLCFVWLGLSWFLGLQLSWCMVGLGVIFLAESLVRMQLSLKVSGAAVLFGVLFLGGGIWHMAQAPWALVPALFVLFGVAMVVRAIASVFRHRNAP